MIKDNWKPKKEKETRKYYKCNKVEYLVKNYMSGVRRGSHWGGSPQNVLRDERTCGTTLASAYVLRRLSVAWSQLQMKEGSLSRSEC